MNIGIINKAIKEAKQSTYKQKIGAVIFKGSNIISSGHNAIRYSSINDKYKFYKNSLHAEQSALLNIDWNKVKNCSILVLKINSLNNLSMAKPCIICQKLLKYVGIKKVYYSNSYGEIVKSKLNEL